MNTNTRKENRLTAKDLINIGVFVAIYLVTYIIVATIAGLTAIGVLVCTSIASLFTGTIYMLMAVKIRKRGVFFIAGMSTALLTLTSGNVFGIVGSVIAAVVSECIASRNHYGKISDLIMAFVTTNVISFVSFMLPMYGATQEYMSKAAERFNLSQETIGAYIKYLNWYTFGIAVVISIVTAFIGALIGLKILNKHFRKAGLIK
ncbi:MAG: MptD family putative ECF transporter S component [Syntrophomonadaceae bacterium]|jgi:energy-coupling factor transport system substrate-specific component|nr:MptD family putative ECF transporter S component [Syntrophomonadaceae bacterium]